MSPTLENAPERLADIALAIYHLRNEIHALSSSPQKGFNVASLQSTLERSRKLDRALVEWRQTLPSTWECQVNLSKGDQGELYHDPASVHPATWLGKCTAYPTNNVSGILTQFRMHRMIVQTVIIRCASGLAAVEQGQDLWMENSDKSIIEMEARITSLGLVDQICASAPFHLGIVAPTTAADAMRPQSPCANIAQSSLINSFQSTPTAPEAISAPTRLQSVLKSSSAQGTRCLLKDKIGAFSLLQALMVANTVPGIPSLQKRWMLDTALIACKRTGIDQKMIETRLRSERSI